jgi:hypothetical protein
MGNADKIGVFKEKLVEQNVIDSIFALSTEGKVETGA